jgi:hypothetical protein
MDNLNVLKEILKNLCDKNCEGDFKIVYEGYNHKNFEGFAYEFFISNKDLMNDKNFRNIKNFINKTIAVYQM